MQNKTDDLSKALEIMQDNLRKVAEDHTQKLWLQNGIAGLSERLRGDKSLKELSKDIIVFLAEYLNSQVGTFYVTEDNTSTLQYSFGLAGKAGEVIQNGEGLLGQAVSEKKVKVFQKTPNKYFKIASSLGEEKPDSLIIIPAVIDNQVVAVIELAKFGDFSENDLHFIDDTKESIAISVNAALSKLKLEKIVEVLNEKEREISDQINAINRSNGAIEFDLNGIILKANESFCNLMGYKEEEIVGKHHSIFLDKETAESTEYKNFWKLLNKGEFQDGDFKRFNKSGEIVWINGSYNPILNLEGKPYKVLKISTDITQAKNQQLELNQQIDSLNNSAIVSIADADGNITFINDLFCTISEYSREELMGQNHRIVKSGKQPDGLFVGMWKAISMGKVWKGEIMNKKKGGGFYWVDTTIVPFKDVNGIIYKYVGIRFDITKQKEQQELLKSQTEELKAQQEELEEANSGLEEQAQKLKASEEELKVQQEELMQANQELEEKSQLLEEKNQAVNEKNEELEAASYELQQKAEELALSSKYKSEFLANMSHELRTPLNSILLLSRLLADNGDKNLSPEQIEFAKVIHNSGNGLLELINEILDLSKIESGKMGLDIEDVTISAVRKNINDMFNALAKEKGISFSVQVLEGIQEHLRTDRIRIEQVLKNFLSNAFKFTEKGKVELIIRTTSEEEATKMRINAANFISFEVKDSGIGIPAEKHAMVFEAFQQADGSTRRKYGGTGLGLSISREIARMLGGDILLESEAGKGSSFTMVIPYDSSAIALDSSSTSFNGFNKNKVSLEAIKPIVPEIDNNVVPFTPDEINDDRLKIGSKDKTILIVEDDTAFAQALLKYVHERGYKAVVAVSGGNAVEYALKYKPIGILLDIQLPVKSGWTIMKELKENPSTKYIPVHMMSSLDIKAKDSIEMGAVDFMNKAHADKDMMKVFDRIEKVLGKEPKKILLVDDNEVHTMAISRFISDASKTCVIAGTAKEAYKILQREPIDCVVLDMGLPDENGYDVLETIKKDERFEKLPVIIYTGKSLSLQEEKKLKQYTAAIIIKTADSFKRLSSEISLFLHLVEDNKEEKILKKPYIKDKVLSDKHILIVDDDVRNIFALTKLLESQQMKVSSASDGNEALSILKKDTGIDLVLMDMMMPNKDGYEATIDIRSNATLKKMPVIAVTAKAMLGDREKCIKAGANDYITKPVDSDQLLSLLRVWLYK